MAERWIQPGKPTQNARVESFHGRLRDECLTVSWFQNLFDARRKIAAWKIEYNEERPHSSLGYLTPKEFAAQQASASLSERQGTQTPSLAPGDAVLRELATRITQSVRSYDLVGRYGGEEFLIVLPSCANTEIDQSANRIRSAVASAPILMDQTKIFVTVSIGGTVTEIGNESAVEILAAADRALYQAKNKGRDRIAIV